MCGGGQPTINPSTSTHTRTNRTVGSYVSQPAQSSPSPISTQEQTRDRTFMVVTVGMVSQACSLVHPSEEQNDAARVVGATLALCAPH